MYVSNLLMSLQRGIWKVDISIVGLWQSTLSLNGLRSSWVKLIEDYQIPHNYILMMSSVYTNHAVF